MMLQKGNSLEPTRIMRYLSSLGSIHQGVPADYNLDLPRVCPHCGSTDVTSQHNWFCSHPALIAARHQNADGLQRTILEAIHVLPPPLLHGIAPNMQLDPRHPYWQGPNTTTTNMQELSEPCKLVLGANVPHALAVGEDLVKWCSDYCAVGAHQAYR